MTVASKCSKNMKHVKTKLGNFLFPSEIEKELKSLTNRELIISFLNDDAKIDVYKLQELQDRDPSRRLLNSTFENLFF